MKKKLKCSICNEEHGDRYGHNAEPIVEGRCCGTCNAIVIVRRLNDFQDRRNKNANA